MASNWRQAEEARQQAIREALECPKCSAQNRPRAEIIEFDPQSSSAVCGVCSHAWTVQPEET